MSLINNDFFLVHLVRENPCYFLKAIIGKLPQSNTSRNKKSRN